MHAFRDGGDSATHALPACIKMMPEDEAAVFVNKATTRVGNCSSSVETMKRDEAITCVPHDHDALN